MNYTFPVTEIVKITDGDTYWLRLDIGFRQTMLVHTRLNGWDTPERNRGTTHEKKMAQTATEQATLFLTSALNGGTLTITTHKDPDNFGRWLADINSGDLSLGPWLHQVGLASKWPTRWREEFDSL